MFSCYSDGQAVAQTKNSFIYATEKKDGVVDCSESLALRITPLLLCFTGASLPFSHFIKYV